MSFDIETAKHAGFCYGVTRAVDTAVETALKEGGCVTLGELIHNEAEIERLKGLGVKVADDLNEVTGTVIIRSHGVPDSVYKEIERLGLHFIDATCPFVAKIHKIVSEAEGSVIVAGDRTHPEVEGIVGHFKGKGDSRIFATQDEKELENILNSLKSVSQNALTMVAQTTFNSAKWKYYKEIAKKHYTNIKIYDTICSATRDRQESTEELAKRAQLMVVVGGKHSSNTAKLAQISQQHCPVIYVQRGNEIDIAEVRKMLSGKSGIIGITAGASTPAYIIKEVHTSMSEMLTNEDIDFMAEVDKTFKKVYIGNRVKALVVAVNNSEAVVDLGTKHSGYIPAAELSQNPNAAPADVVSVGDEIEAIVTAINDAEGTVTLSKKRVDSVLGIEKMTAYMQSAETITGVVVSVVKGGVIVVSNDVRVFIPASHTGVPKEGNLEELKNKEVSFKVIEVTENRGRVVGSIRQAKKEANDAAKAKFWESIEEGQKFTGEVKSIESYGVFVDLGGVDGMVHSSELTWERIKHPREIVKIGDKLDVYVKSFDPDKKRVSLGCKKAEDDPWLKFTSAYNVEDVVDAKIVSITPFGAFAQIIPGIDGLIHISQVSNQRVNNVAQVLSIGDEVKAMITEINEESKRISLSIRALLGEAEEAPAEEAAEDAE